MHAAHQGRSLTDVHPAPSTDASLRDGRTRALVLGALGVVFGDIGTSPLYAVRACFLESHGVAVGHASVLGVLSLVVWTLLLIVAVKYVWFVLRADNRGEGGILALLSLAVLDAPARSRRRAALVALGVFGAALLYGDGIITPCITVMGALEGLHVVTPSFADYTVPATVAVLVVLFLFQRSGTGRVGAVMGPVMLVWFATLAVLGVRGIAMRPEVLQSLSPAWALGFVGDHGAVAFVVMGTVFLVATGAEALYADLGHFGLRAMRIAWFAVAFPALLLNYLGQGALLLARPDAVANPFFLLAPEWSSYPLVALSLVASAIASQAVITGTFSITMQAIQLGYLPRLEIRHTSPDARGQIYLPHVNWLLLLACVVTCVGFGSSGALAAAYGIAVTTTMSITTVLLWFAARRVFGWPAWASTIVCSLFGGLELVFLGANATKAAHGGWFPLLVAGAIATVMFTWKTGRRVVYERYSENTVPLESLVESLRHDPPVRVPGTAVYMAGSANGTPLALLHNLEHNHVLHRQVLLVTIQVSEEPHTPAESRLRTESLPLGFHRLVATYGFMEQARVLEVLKRWLDGDGELRISETTFFLSRETIVPARRRRMARWRSVLFAFLQRNAQPATAFFGLPVNRVVELGTQVEL